MDTSYLQFLLYILGAILLGALIVLVIKIVYSVNRINSILDSVEMKMKTVDKAFGAVDRIVDSFSMVTDKVVDGIASGISKVFNHKKKKKDKEEVEEE
jgi:phage-related protein